MTYFRMSTGYELLQAWKKNRTEIGNKRRIFKEFSWNEEVIFLTVKVIKEVEETVWDITKIET